jgi:CRP-like cAMP-binding protein
MPSQPNRILKMLTAPEFELVKQNCDLVYLHNRQALWEQGEELTVAYMPCSAVISLLQTMSDGLSIEVASVGNEGIVGVPLLLDIRKSISRAICQVEGEAWKIGRTQLAEIQKMNPTLARFVRRYTYVLLRQIMQAAGCSCLHSAEKRFARILLEMHDRSGKRELQLSQQFVTEILGVRRETIGQIAPHFQRSGLISYIRGRIRILNRAGIEASACECYSILKQELDDIFH